MRGSKEDGEWRRTGSHLIKAMESCLDVQNGARRNIKISFATNVHDVSSMTLEWQYEKQRIGARVNFKIGYIICNGWL